MGLAQQLLRAAGRMRDDVDALSFDAPVTCVYNPLRYAWAAHRQYVERYATGPKRVLFIGMNPGPWGMAQTGVPFGEVESARDWLRVEAKVRKPDPEHPKRPVQGFDCPRSEVSGRRVWGLFRERFETPARFFRHHYVSNYCPLVFMEDSGRNRTPDKLPVSESAPLYEICNRHLARVVEVLEPRWLIAVGVFAEARAAEVLDGGPTRIVRILHPSPASPAANRDWAGQATAQLVEAGVWD